MTPLEISEYLLEQRREEMQNMTPKHIFHNSNTYTHTLRVAYHANILNSELSLPYSEFQQLSTACFAHDLGKVETWNPKGSPWFRGHEEVSADILVANGFDEDDDIVNAVRYHGRLQQFDKMGHKARLKLLNKISNVKLFIMLQLCDAEGFSDYGRTQALKQLKEFVYFVCDNVVFNVFGDETYPIWLQIVIDEILPTDMTDAFGTPNAFGDNNDD